MTCRKENRAAGTAVDVARVSIDRPAFAGEPGQPGRGCCSTIPFRNNIAFNAIGKTDAEVKAAANAANVMEFVNQQPQGFDTLLTDRGQKFFPAVSGSGFPLHEPCSKDSPAIDPRRSDRGARQRIGAARCSKSLEFSCTGRTTLVIAIGCRRSRTPIESSCSIRDGSSKMGNHHELLARGGLYAALHGMQFQRLNGAGMSVQSKLNKIWYEGAPPPWWLMPLSVMYGVCVATASVSRTQNGCAGLSR